ncbi:MAG: hypothetical protein V1915_03545 [Candidatus Bathyarchaeota archaeon]
MELTINHRYDEFTTLFSTKKQKALLDQIIKVRKIKPQRFYLADDLLDYIPATRDNKERNKVSYFLTKYKIIREQPPFYVWNSDVLTDFLEQVHRKTATEEKVDATSHRVTNIVIPTFLELLHEFKNKPEECQRKKKIFIEEDDPRPKIFRATLIKAINKKAQNVTGKIIPRNSMTNIFDSIDELNIIENNPNIEEHLHEGNYSEYFINIDKLPFTDEQKENLKNVALSLVKKLTKQTQLLEQSSPTPLQKILLSDPIHPQENSSS